MKKIWLVLALISVVSLSYADWPVGVEAGAGYVLADNNNHLFINGSALINIKNNIYARLQIARLSFHSGNTIIDIGTMTPIDLMMFFESQTFNPYGLAGINLTTGGGSTIFDARIGGGVEFKLNQARFHPFVEAILDLYSISYGGTSNSDNIITLKGGIRLR